MQHRLAKLLVTGLYLSEYHVEGDTAADSSNI